MRELKYLRGFQIFTNGFFIGSTVTGYFAIKLIKKRFHSFAEAVTTYNTNLSIMQTREKALMELLEPVIEHLSEDAIIAYNNTVEFLDLVEFNDIRNPF